MTHRWVGNALGAALIMLAMPMLAMPAPIVSAGGASAAAGDGSPAERRDHPAQAFDSHDPEALPNIDHFKSLEDDVVKRFGASGLLMKTPASSGEIYVPTVPAEKAAAPSPNATDTDRGLPEWHGFELPPVENGTIIYIAPSAKSLSPQSICEEPAATIARSLPQLVLPTHPTSAAAGDASPLAGGGYGRILRLGVTVLLIGLLLGALAWRIAHTRHVLR